MRHTLIAAVAYVGAMAFLDWYDNAPLTVSENEWIEIAQQEGTPRGFVFQGMPNSRLFGLSVEGANDPVELYPAEARAIQIGRRRIEIVEVTPEEFTFRY